MAALNNLLVAGESADRAEVKLGSLLAAGEAFPLDVSEVASGGLSLGGAADESAVFPQVWTEVAAGGMTLGGAADQYALGNWYVSGAGGMTLGGAAIESATTPTTWDESGAGGMTLGGLAAISAEFVELAAGGLSLGGEAQDDAGGNATYTASGGMSLGGAAENSLQVGIATEPEALSATLPALTSELAALGGSIATIGATLPLLQADLAGSVIRISATLPAMTSTLSARAGSIATISARLPAMAAVAGGSNPVVGNINATLPLLDAQSSALAGSLGALSATIPALNATLRTALGVSASISATLPALSFAGSAAQQVSGSIDASLPALSARLTGSVSAIWVDALCMNTRTTAVTRFTNYHFNSFARVGNNYYAAGPDGVFQIDVGTTDNGAPIEASFTTGLMDFGSQHLKRATHLYAALRSETSMRVSVTPDEGYTIDYLLPPINAGAIEQRRKILAAGPRGRYWQFEVANVDGGAFEIDELNAMVGDTGRRV